MCAMLRGSSPRNPRNYKGFSLCCVLVRSAANRLAGILSPQRLPFRHPGRADREKIAWTRAGSKRIIRVTRLVPRIKRPRLRGCLAICDRSLCHKPSESELHLLTTVSARDSFGASSISVTAPRMFQEESQLAQAPSPGSRSKLWGPVSLISVKFRYP